MFAIREEGKDIPDFEGRCKRVSLNFQNLMTSNWRENSKFFKHLPVHMQIVFH